MTQLTSFRKITASLSLLLLGGGIALGGNHLINSPQSFANESNSPTETEANNLNANVNATDAIALPQNYVSKVVQQGGNSVVRIDASRTVATSPSPAFNDPFFRQFFGSQIPNMPTERVQRGFGSGFIVSSDGLIITNAHVVDGSDKVEVTLKDGKTYAGEVMGTDSLTDVAVIKIEADNLPAVTFANSEELQPGEWAIAIGNPLGLDNTVTTGIVSATGRTSSQIGVADKRVSFVQTDAAINPGNSGGPLLNAKGEVIGVNTAIIQNAQGIGFAIPVNTARDIAEELIAKGKVDHPFLGIQMAQITPELKKQFNSRSNKQLSADEGILIVEVVPNSPADKARLRSGDVIQKINNKSVTQADEVQQTVAKTEVGAKLPLQLQRDNKQLQIDVTVGILPQPQQTGR